MLQPRALSTFEGAAAIHKLPLIASDNVSNHLVLPSPMSSLYNHTSVPPCLSRMKNKPVSIAGAVYGSLPYEAFGYELRLVCWPYFITSSLTLTFDSNLASNPVPPFSLMQGLTRK